MRVHSYPDNRIVAYSSWLVRLDNPRCAVYEVLMASLRFHGLLLPVRLLPRLQAGPRLCANRRTST